MITALEKFTAWEQSKQTAISPVLQKFKEWEAAQIAIPAPPTPLPPVSEISLEPEAEPAGIKTMPARILKPGERPPPPAWTKAVLAPPYIAKEVVTGTLEQVLPRIPLGGDIGAILGEAVRRGAVEGNPLGALWAVPKRLYEKVIEAKYLTLEEAAGLDELPAWAKYTGEAARFGLDFTSPKTPLALAKRGVTTGFEGVSRLAAKSPDIFKRSVAELTEAASRAQETLARSMGAIKEGVPAGRELEAGMVRIRKPVPEFGSSEEAIAYGKSIVGKTGEIAKLESEAKKITGQLKELEKLPEPPAQQYADLAVKKQFIKEALAEAKSGVKPIAKELEPLAEKIEDVGGKVNPDGTVTVYHRTEPNILKMIEETGKIEGTNNIYFSVLPKGRAEVHGEGVVKLNIPLSKMQVEEIFPDEVYLRYPIKQGESINIEKYTPKDYPELAKKALVEAKPPRLPLPSQGYWTPVKVGEQKLAEIQSAGLPRGKFIALDKPFESPAHDIKHLKEIEIPKLQKIYDPDGLLGKPSPSVSDEFASFYNKTKPKDLRQAYTDFLRGKGYDAYIRGIDGDPLNRELIILNPGQHRFLERPVAEAKVPPVPPTAPPVPSPAGIAPPAVPLVPPTPPGVAPWATGKPRVSQLNLKQFGLSPENETKLRQIISSWEIPTQSWQDVERIVNAMTPEDIEHLIRSRGAILSGPEVKAMVREYAAGSEEIDRLAPFLKSPATRSKVEGQIQVLENRVNRALSKIFATGTEAGRTLNLFRMIMKKTYNPDYWVLSARRVAKRELSAPVIARVRELAVTRQGEELTYLLSNLAPEKGLPDSIIPSLTLADYRSTIKGQLKLYRTMPEIKTKEGTLIAIDDALQQLGKDIRSEEGLPLGDKITFQSEIKASRLLVKEETNKVLKKLLTQEKATAEPVFWLHKARQIYGKEISPQTKATILDAVSRKDTDALREIMQGLRPQGWLNQLLGIPRTIKATLDQSMPFRQGIFMVSHPVKFTKAFLRMWPQAFSETYYLRFWQRIKADPLYAEMVKAKVPFTNVLSNPEEMFISKLPEKIPLFGRVVKWSNRGASGFLNSLRADAFRYYHTGAVKSGVPITDKFLQSAGSFIASATGRGNIPLLQREITNFGSVLFSARLQVSRINLLNPVYYYRLHPYIRREAIKTGLASLGMGLTTLGLVHLSGLKVGLNPFSSDFGKIKIGDTRYDIWGGFQQYMVLIARLIAGRTVSAVSGKVTKLGEGYRPATRTDIIERFFESKTAPHINYSLSLLRGQDFEGKPIDIPAETLNLFIPMILDDIYDISQKEGIEGIPLAMPGFFGVGIQTFGRQRESSLSERIIRGKPEKMAVFPMVPQTEESPVLRKFREWEQKRKAQ